MRQAKQGVGRSSRPRRAMNSLNVFGSSEFTPSPAERDFEEIPPAYRTRSKE